MSKTKREKGKKERDDKKGVEERFKIVGNGGLKDGGGVWRKARENGS